MSERTTIAAIASPPGPAERGVVRVSGPASAALLRATWAGSDPPRLGERGVFTTRFDDGRGEQPALVLWMPGPRSYTREDVAEFHLPGSPPLLHCALARLIELGARSARPGEFTRRAFESGRIDLTRAEGVLELIAAENATERRAALALLHGGLDARIGALRDSLEGLRALCEASLDFDESDTGHVPRAELSALAAEVRAGLEEALGWEERRTPSAGEATVVLCGAPNAGKSSLYNRLVGEEEVLVSALAGTTRDGASGRWALAGAAVRLYDSPGIDAAARGVEARVQTLSRQTRLTRDLCLWVVDATRDDPDALRAEFGELSEGPPMILVWNKVDLEGAAPAPTPEWLAQDPAPIAAVSVSATQGRGLAELARAAADALGYGGNRELAIRSSAGPIRELSGRHRAALREAVAELEAGLRDWAAGAPLELFAEALRGTTDRLEEISGRTTPEHLLDRIFAQFCLGK